MTNENKYHSIRGYEAKWGVGNCNIHFGMNYLVLFKSNQNK